MAKAPPAPSIAAQRLAQGAVNNAAKYVENATARAAAFATEVATPEALRNYTAGVSGAGPRWQRNAQQAGANAYSAGVSSKGSIRYGPGVGEATAKYTRNVTPYFQVIAATPLPPKGPRGPGNVQRVTALATALNQARLGRTAGAA